MNSEPRTTMFEGPIAKKLLYLALPILLSSVLQSLNGSVNAMWVGFFLGETALAATANSNTLLSFLVAIIMGIGMACSILVGQSLGGKNIEQAKRIVGTGATSFVAFALLISASGLAFSERLLILMHTPLDVQPLATSYLRVMFIALPTQVVYIFLTIILRSAGDARTPLKYLALAVGLDICLNPLLIMGAWRVPGLGIAGSATSTLVAQSVAVVALTLSLYRRGHFLCLQASEAHLLRPNWAILKSIVTKGLAMGLQMAVVSLSMVVMISLVNRFGSQMSAAYGACLQLWNYIQMPALAIGMAVTSMAAQNIGARRLDRVQRITGTAIAFNVLMTGALVTALHFLSHAVLGAFLAGQVQTIKLAQHINSTVAWSFIPLSVTFVLSSVARASGAVMPPLAILFLAFWGIRLPFAALLMDTSGANALWWSFGIGSISAMLMSITYHRLGGWRHAATLKEPQPSVEVAITKA